MRVRRNHRKYRVKSPPPPAPQRIGGRTIARVAYVYFGICNNFRKRGYNYIAQQNQRLKTKQFAQKIICVECVAGAGTPYHECAVKSFGPPLCFLVARSFVSVESLKVDVLQLQVENYARLLNIYSEGRNRKCAKPRLKMSLDSRVLKNDTFETCDSRISRQLEN